MLPVLFVVQSSVDSKHLISLYVAGREVDQTWVHFQGQFFFFSSEAM
jgi:hypothetical protein